MTKEKQLSESVQHWIKIVKEQVTKGNPTIYTVLRSVSRSGMSRKIDVYIMIDNSPYCLNQLIADLFLYKRDKSTYTLKVNGCGMDMGFDVVYRLSTTLYHFSPNRSEDCGYILKQRWL